MLEQHMTHRSCWPVSLCMCEKSCTTDVEVGKDDQETAILGSKHVLGRYLDIVESDVGSSRRCRVGGLDLLCFDSLASGHEEDRQASIGLQRQLPSLCKGRGYSSLWRRR